MAAQVRLLLETYAFVWALTEDRRLGAAARLMIVEEAEEVFVGVLALWEIALKAASGRMPVRTHEAGIALARSRYLRLSPVPAHVVILAALPQHSDHRDPFDRMLVAQALAERLTLMTDDAKLGACGVPTISCA